MDYAVLDWDYTLHDGYTMFQWISFLQERKLLGEKISEDLAGLKGEYDAGRLSHDEYARIFGELFGSSLKGLSYDKLALLVREFTADNRKCLYPFTGELLKWLQSHNIIPVLVTGAPAEILEEYSRFLDIEVICAFEAEKENGVYTGRVKRHCGYGKERIMKELLSKYGKKPVMGFGDSGSDIPLLAGSERCFVIAGSRDARPLQMPCEYTVIARNMSGPEATGCLES